MKLYKSILHGLVWVNGIVGIVISAYEWSLWLLLLLVFSLCDLLSESPKIQFY